MELVNDEGLIAPYLASFSVVVFKPENKSQLNILKDPKSIRMNDFLINTSISVSLFSNMLVFRDTNNSFKLDGDLLKTMTNYDISVSHLNPQDQKQIHEFGKEMNFNIKQKGRNTNRDESLIKLLELPAIMASGISTRFLSSDPNELCDKLNCFTTRKTNRKQFQHN